jgi:hypothetical protein
MMADPAIPFAIAFDKHFRDLTHGAGHSEIFLFRAMHTALVRAGAGLRVEEYHGTSHQVRFIGNGSCARSSARCELCDLLIIIYSQHTGEARLTFLQAKSERKPVNAPCSTKFSANLEQWFLLANRPVISGFGAFDPPSNLLASAMLPSVGSFGFFYRTAGGDFQTYFAVANYLSPPVAYTQRQGRLQPMGPCGLRSTGGHQECHSAADNLSFAENLYRMHIGSPIHPIIVQASDTRNWLAANLRYQIRQASQQPNPSIGLAQELLELLAPNDNESLSSRFGAKCLLVIKSDGY